MREALVIMCLPILLLGCSKPDKVDDAIEVLQINNMVGRSELCYNESVGFENYILYGDSTSDSIHWYTHNGQSPPVWEKFATGNPIELSVHEPGPFIRYEFHGTDSTYSRFWKISCYRYIYIPNGFSPWNGIIREWKPVVSDYQGTIDQYLLRVVTPSGMTVFETNNMDDGWDGSYEGELVPGGPYLYYIRLEFSDNSFTEYTGDLAIVL